MKRKLFRILFAVMTVMILALGMFTGCSWSSAYDLAVKKGFDGTETEWLESLKGKSAYEIACDNGFEGSQIEWLASLKSDGYTLEELYDFYVQSNPGSTMEQFVELIAGAENDPVQQAAQSALRSVVSIQARFSNVPAGESNGSGGSGVIYKVNAETGVAYIITNYHVIYNLNASPRVSGSIQVAPYGREYFPATGSELTLSVKAEFVGGSITRDIAILKTVANTVFNNDVYRAVKVADSNRLKVGEPVLAAGNPEDEGISVTRGILNVDSEFISMQSFSNPNQTEINRVMRVDAAINKGNSGGGLFNKNGELIGIVNAKAIMLEIDSIGYAIPSNVAVGIANNVIDNVRHNSNFIKYSIGIRTRISGSWAELDDGAVRIREEIVVDSIKIGNPAATAPVAKRLSTGDTLLSAQLHRADGEERAPQVEITRSFTLADYMYCAREGDVLTLTVLRGGQQVECEATISPDYYAYLEQLSYDA